ncbi:MAG: HAD-IB family hydrolase [SAR86 cluster bacterium]|jgi:HAD superfamily hydrolase (TIGR01490 family)|nr:HAD family hydrolase [Pseudomonadota bacterium]MDA9028098.1 HAD-IB family hydrolase [Gammaproteobacteria bacterium]MDO7578058.1 HAD-IB family hydrolase [SAR86 cluster bacterium]MDA9916686.1 HAD-IB family hydrolase [Gammaproteobacteria bacterium]MDO7543027.1 HAD-IB family hydrolase [Gammaproteobacteria bacterium]
MSKPALVIFDLDNTILNGDSDYAMINYLVHTQALDESAGKKNQLFIEDYQRGELDFDAYTTFALSAYIGMTRSEINEFMLPFVAKVIEPMINTLALKIIHDHGDSGDTILLASATNELIVQPIAQRLDIHNVIGTQVKFINGKCTGEYIPPSALGAGKKLLVQQWMQKNNFDDFSGVTFYSDSINDLPLLEAVDFPKAVNPDAMLEKISLKRGWEIIDLPIL